nr:flap endonuclease gen like 1 [Quercus suber]
MSKRNLDGYGRLWEALGDGEICSIADYAARFFETHQRPLRIAVDEACWRFTNLTDEQVQSIRNGEPAANPVEKTILWRVLRLLKLNVQLLFVYDGPKRPWKRGKRGGGRISFELTRLLHTMFDHLKIPYHQAPGEAEAECAKLNRLGIVDAVWSDDGDAFMFGCQTLIRQHKVGGKIVTSKSNEGPLGMAKVFTADYLREHHDLDADSLVLFAMLAGGDYDLTGLRGCGTKTASLIAKCQYGVASALCHVSQDQLPMWREHLAQTLRAVSDRAVEVPYTFPDWKALGHYRNPSVSTEEQLQTLRGLRKGWDVPVVLADLRIFLRERFNFGTREFLKHISPIFLVRALARATPEQRRANQQYGIALKRTRTVKPKEGEEARVKSEIKISFSPLFNFPIDINRPSTEDWSKWAAKDGTPYDPTHDLDFEILDCFLHHGLPKDGYPLEATRTPRKRKASTATPSSSVEASTMTASSCKQQARSSPPVASLSDTGSCEIPSNGQKALSPTMSPNGMITSSLSASSEKNPDAAIQHRSHGAVKPSGDKSGTIGTCGAPLPKFRIPRVVTSALLDAAVTTTPLLSNIVIDLDDPFQDSETLYCEVMALAHKHQRNTMARSTKSTNTAVAATSVPSTMYEPTNATLLSPGTVIDPRTLRQLRQTSTVFKNAPSSQKIQKLAERKPPLAEVIDLTISAVDGRRLIANLYYQRTFDRSLVTKTRASTFEKLSLKETALYITLYAISAILLRYGFDPVQQLPPFVTVRRAFSNRLRSTAREHLLLSLSQHCSSSNASIQDQFGGQLMFKPNLYHNLLVDYTECYQRS